MSRKRPLGLFAALYQVAGTLILAPERLTNGQQERLRVLLLDVLSDPERWTGKLVADAHRRMLEP